MTAGWQEVIPFWLWAYPPFITAFLLYAWMTLDAEKHCQGIWVPWLRSWARAQDVWPWFGALVFMVVVSGFLFLRG